MMSTDSGKIIPEQPDETLKCRICSAESDWTDGFVADSNVVHGPHHICSTCYLYREKYRRYYSSWLWWIAVTVGLGFFLSGSIPEALLFAVGVYVLMYLAIVLHELGHLIAAYSVGVHVPAVSFGGGLRAKVIRLRNTFLILSPTPSEGLIVPAYSTSEHFRKKAFLILAAGPLVNLVAALLGMVALISIGDDLSDYASAALTLWTAINTYLAIVNLFSFTHKTAFGVQQSDGAQIWGLRQKTDDEIEEILRQRNVVLASLEFHLGDKERSLAIIEREIGHGDGSALTQSLITATLAETGQLDRGIALGQAYLENEDLGVMERAMLQNNLAFTFFLAGGNDDLDEADSLSAKAIKTLPMILAVKGTRGSVLIAKGRYEEGVDLLTDKRFRLETASHQATVKSIRAKGLAYLGKREGARKSLSAARSLDPSNRHIPAAEAAIAAISV